MSATASTTPVELVEERIPTEAGSFLARSARGHLGSQHVLLLHGLSASTHLWDDSVRALAAQGVFPLSVDLLGHGHSDKPTRLFTVRDHASALLTLIDALGWDKVTLVGNSFGSLVSMALAAARPDRVTRVIAIGCPAWSSQRERTEWLHDRTHFIDMSTGQPAGREPAGTSAAAGAMAEDYGHIGIWLLNSMWAIHAYDLMADLGTFRTELHALYGDSDWLLATRRNLECVGPAFGVIPKAGHLAPLDNPEGTAEAIDEILRTGSADGRNAGGQGVL